MIKKIIIEQMSDYSDCEQCGGGSEQGGRVTIDDKIVFEYIPVGSCYGNNDIYIEDLFVEALKYLGYDVEIKYE